MRRTTWPFVAAVLLGCGSGESPSAPVVPAPVASPAAACAEKTAALQARLTRMPASSPIRVPADLASALPTSPRGLSVIETGLLLTLGPSPALDGVGLEAADDDLRARELGQIRERQALIAERLGRPTSRVVYVAGPGPERVDRVRRLLAKMPDYEVRIVVRPPSALTPPAPAPVVPPHLAAILSPSAPLDPATRAEQLARALQIAIGTCEPLRRSFSAIATVSPEQRVSILIQAVAEGMAECQCQGMDVDGLSALLVATLDPGPAVAWVPLPATATGTLADVAVAP
jgi:hypothetical protein